MPGISVFPPRGAIKSIQAGVITIPANTASANVTVTAFNTASYVLTFLGSMVVSDAANATYGGYLDVVNSTTIRASRGTTSGTTPAANVGYQLTEYY